MACNFWLTELFFWTGLKVLCHVNCKEYFLTIAITENLFYINYN